MLPHHDPAALAAWLRDASPEAARDHLVGGSHADRLAIAAGYPLGRLGAVAWRLLRDPAETRAVCRNPHLTAADVEALLDQAVGALPSDATPATMPLDLLVADLEAAGHAQARAGAVARLRRTLPPHDGTLPGDPIAPVTRAARARTILLLLRLEWATLTADALEAFHALAPVAVVAAEVLQHPAATPTQVRTWVQRHHLHRVVLDALALHPLLAVAPDLLRYFTLEPDPHLIALAAPRLPDAVLRMALQTFGRRGAAPLRSFAALLAPADRARFAPSDLLALLTSADPDVRLEAQLFLGQLAAMPAPPAAPASPPAVPPATGPRPHHPA